MWFYPSLLRNRVCRALAGSVTLLAASACAALPDDNGMPVDITELGHAEVCNSASGAAAVTTLPDTAALHAWQQAHRVDLTGDRALPRGPFAIIEHGARNTGGYALTILEPASVTDGVLTFHARFTGPEHGQLRAQVLTSPCVLVELPPGPYQIVQLLDARGQRRAIADVSAAQSAAVAPVDR